MGEWRAGIAAAVCKSGRFETGNGTCALRCMDQLGDARRNCQHRERIFAWLLDIIEDEIGELEDQHG